MGQHDNDGTTADMRRKVGAAATVTVVGGALLVNGVPVDAADFVVTNLDGSGPGSLADAVADANADPALDTITFADGLSGTISLDARLAFRYDVSIVGPGDGSIVLTNASGDALYLYNGASLTLSGVDVDTDGNAIAANRAGTIDVSGSELFGEAGTLDLDAVGDVTLDAVTLDHLSSQSTIDDANAIEFTDVTFTAHEPYAFLGDDLTVAGALSVVADGVVGDANNDARIRLQFIGSGAAPFADDVGVAIGPALSLSHLSGDVGVFLRDGVGDVHLHDLSTGEGGHHAVNVSYLDGVLDVAGAMGSSSLYARNVDSVAVEDASWAHTLHRSTGLRTRNTGPVSFERVEFGDPDPDAGFLYSLSRFAVHNASGGEGPGDPFLEDAGPALVVSDVSGSGWLYAGQIEGDVEIDAIDLGGVATSIRLYNVAGDIDVSDVVLDASLYSSLVVDGVNRFSGGPRLDVAEEHFEVSISDVTIGGTTGAGFARLSDLTATGGEGEEVSEPGANANVELSRLTVAGPLRIDDSAVEGTNILLGPTNRQFGLFRSLDDGFEFEQVDSDELIGDGPPALSVGRADVSLTNLTVSGHTSRYAISLYGADVSLSHATFADNELSVASISASYGATLYLDHVVIDDVGPDGAFVVEGDSGPRKKAAAQLSEPLEPLTLTSEFSLLPTGAIAGQGLSDSNVETDDARMGPLQDNSGPQLTMVPLAGSPAVNAGDPTIEAAPEFDQRGEARIVETIDIGATESTPLFESSTPARFVDTRTGGSTLDDLFEAGGARPAGSTYVVQIGGRGEVPSDAKAVIMNITAVQAAGTGYVTAYSCDDDQPNASSLNFTSGVNAGNEIITGLADDGSVCLFVSESTHLTVDVVGYATRLSAYEPVTPARTFESRIGLPTEDGRFASAGRLAAGSQRTIVVAGRHGIPDDASSVIINVAAVNPAETGHVTVHPCVSELPNTSSLNYIPGSPRANELLVPLNEFGEMCVYTSADTDLVIDVSGYLPNGAIEGVEPARLHDSRATGETIDGVSEATGQAAADSTTVVPVAGRADIPADVKSVVVNVTAINPSAPGWATVSSCITPPPTASSLNFVTGVNRGNEVIAQVSADGDICIYASEAAHFTVDVVAFIR